MIEKLRGELEIPVGRLVVNQCRPPAPSGAAEATLALELDSGGNAARRSLALAARRALGWLRLQEDGIAALERRFNLRAKRLPRLAGEPFAWAEIERLAACLADGRGDE